MSNTGNRGTRRPRIFTALAAAAVAAAMAIGGATAASASDFGAVPPQGANFVVTWGSDAAGTAAVPAGLTGKRVVQVAATSTASYALTDDGRITAWGDSGAAAGAIPSAVASAFITTITAGSDGQVFARAKDGSLFGWGCANARSYGDIGNRLPGQVQPLTDAEKAMRAPTDPPVPAIRPVVDVASAGGRAVAVASDGTLVSWACGDAQGNRPYADTLPSALTGTHFTHVGSTDQGFVVIANGGDASAQDAANVASAWNPASPSQPVQSYRLPGGLTFSNVFGGPSSWMLASDGSVRNWNGGVPSGPTAPIARVASASAFSVAVDANGTLSAWDNASLGPVALPASLAGRHATSVAAAGGHAVAVVAGAPDPVASGQAVVTTAPASVATGAWESDTQLRVFGERYDYVLPNAVTVDGTVIPAGTKVNSYYVNADSVGSANTLRTFKGSLAFPTRVLGIAVLSADVAATNSTLGAPGTTYATGSDQGAERWYGDSVGTTADGKGVNLSFSVYNTSDAVRIITAAG